ncbi:MAG: hypothetical protein RI988_494, partial [Pseudomonadota bacterium]
MSRRPFIEAIEPRLLYSADFATALLADAFRSLRPVEEGRVDMLAVSPVTHEATTRVEVVVIDAVVPDAASLIADLRLQQQAGRPLEIVTLQAGEDGIARLSALLLGREDIGALHVLGHGADGVVQLGGVRLDAATLLARAGEIAQWGRALSEDADVLIYGCDVAASEAGRQLVADLAALTGADVAASQDATGAEVLGGDWVLEVQTGPVQAAIAPSLQARQQWNALLPSAPAIAAIANQATDEDTALAGLPITLSYPDGQVANVVLTATSSDASVVAPGGLVFSGIGANRLLTITPVANAFGPVTITVTAADGALSSSRSFTLTVGALNDAPTAAGTAALTLVEDDIAGAGTPISTFLAAQYSDAADRSAATSLAATAITRNLANAATEGKWQYSASGSTGWTDVPTSGLSDSAALVLPAAYSLRFLPVAHFNGTPGGLTVRLADGSQGSVAFSSSTNLLQGIGGSGRWSEAAVTVAGNVAAVNDRPVASGTSTLSAVNEDTSSPGGARLSTLVTASNYSDATDGAQATVLAGVAIVGNAATAAQGTWEYSGDGSSGWTAVPTSPSDSAALVLRADAFVRFKPAANFNGTPGALTVRLADSSQGAFAQSATTADISGALGSTGIWSDATVSLGASVTAVNDQPTISSLSNVTIDEDTSTDTLSFTIGDVETAAASLTVTAASSNTTLVPNTAANLTLGGSGADRTLRVTPAANANGSATITITVTDASGGGRLRSFALTVETVNDAPVASGSATLMAVAEDASSPAGATVASLFAGNYDNSIDGAGSSGLEAVAVVANASLSSQGKWQYSAGSSTWTDIPPSGLSDSAALILPNTYRLRFLPAADYFGSPGALTVRLADGSDGDINFNASRNLTGQIGGTNEWSLATVSLGTHITAVNDAPQAAGGATLAAMFEDESSPEGTILSAALAAAYDDTMKDTSTASALAGVAITANAATAAQGTWQYSANGVSGWTAIPTSGLSTSAALVLPASYSVRFVPTANFDGYAGTLTLRLSDSSTGAVSFGSAVNISAAAGSTGNWSAGSTALGVLVQGVNDAPLVAGSASLAAVVEDSLAPAGVTVTNLFAANYADTADGAGATALAGAAVVGNAATAAQGLWQYSADGSSWSDVPNSGLSASAALLLTPGHQLRFLPAANYAGTPGPLTVRLADGSQGTVASAPSASLLGAVGGAGNWSAGVVVLSTSVIADNDAPTLAIPTADQSVALGSPFTLTIPGGAFVDSDAGDVLTYTATKADGTALPGWLSFDAVTRTFSGTPANTDVGVTGIRVTATDKASAIASDDFLVTVTNVNDAPTVANAIPDQTATEEAAFSFALPADTFADVDAGDALSYTATKDDGTALPAWLVFDPASRTFSGTPANGDVGEVQITVTAADKSGEKVSDTFKLTVANTNDAPTLATAIGDQSATEDTAYTFQVPSDAFSDIDAGDALSYTATKADGTALPGWLVFDPASRTFSGMPANGDVGEVQITVTAADKSGEKVSDTFKLTVANTNDAPTLATAIEDQTATEDAAFSFALPANTFADVDAGDALSYTATKDDGAALPGWLAFDAATSTFSGTPANADVGALDIQVTTTDKSGEKVSDTFKLTVANVNDAPTLDTAIGDQTATEDAAFSFVVPANTFADVDAGDTLSHIATKADGSALPGWLAFD